MTTPTILIQSLIRRAGGSKIPLYGKEYHFKPDDASDPDAIHTCAVPVEDAEAIHRFKQIPEGYKILSDAADLPPAPKAPAGQTIHATKLAEIVDAALIQKPPVPPIFLENGDDKVELTAMSREDLAEFAKENFGIKAHHKWSDDTLINKILEAARGAD
jgi:hypothetical protein